MAEKKTSIPGMYDVIVIGGGPSGCAMTALLAAQGIRTVCVDMDNPENVLHPSFDGRTMAISFGSQKVLTAAGIWESLTPHLCPIEDIKITESGSPVLLEFLKDDVATEAFGWVVELQLLRKALFERLADLPFAVHLAPAKAVDFALTQNGVRAVLENGQILEAALVIGADGRKSFTREWMGIGSRGWSYDQNAVVCVVEHEHTHANTAIEDFRPDGPFAILPMTNGPAGEHRSTLVWTEHGKTKQSVRDWDKDVFNAALNERFPAFYGPVRLAGPRYAYPLGLIHAYEYTGPRMALVADAAHGIHPIAGQGLNLGLRDIAALYELIVKAKSYGEDLGSEDLLDQYARSRKFDNMAMAGCTDALNKIFSNPSKAIGAARRAGLQAIQKLPLARKFFMKQAMGISGHLPNLVKNGKI